MDPFTAIALISTIVGTGLGVAGRMKAQKAEKDARGLQASQDRIKAQREKTQQIRQAMARRAEILASGEASGAGGSSAVAGGMASVSGQAASNIQYVGTQQMFGQAMARQSQRHAEGIGLVNLGAGVAQVGQAVGMAGPDIFAPKLNVGSQPKEIFAGGYNAGGPDF